MKSTKGHSWTLSAVLRTVVDLSLFAHVCSLQKTATLLCRVPITIYFCRFFEKLFIHLRSLRTSCATTSQWYASLFSAYTFELSWQLPESPLNPQLLHPNTTPVPNKPTDGSAATSNSAAFSSSIHVLHTCIILKQGSCIIMKHRKSSFCHDFHINIFRPYSYGRKNHPLKTLKFDVFYHDLPIDNVRLDASVRFWPWKILANLP